MVYLADKRLHQVKHKLLTPIKNKEFIIIQDNKTDQKMDALKLTFARGLIIFLLIFYINYLTLITDRKSPLKLLNKKLYIYKVSLIFLNIHIKSKYFLL